MKSSKNAVGTSTVLMSRSGCARPVATVASRGHGETMADHRVVRVVLCDESSHVRRVVAGHASERHRRRLDRDVDETGSFGQVFESANRVRVPTNQQEPATRAVIGDHRRIDPVPPIET